MSNITNIAQYKEPPSKIAPYRESSCGLKPEPVYSGWTNFVSQKSVRAIAMSRKSGCLWLATWGGVICWKWKDNQPYQRYSSEHGIAGNEVACLCLDESDRPWVGHSEGGLSYFDGQRWQVYSSLQTDSIRALTDAGSHTGIYVADQERVYYIANINQQPIPIPVMPDEDGTVETLALLADKEELLIGNTWGLFRASVDKIPEPIAVENIQSCTALAQDGDGRIWIGTPEGLYSLENDEVKSEAEEISDRVLALASGEKRVWVLTTNGLFQIFDDSCLEVPNPKEGTTIRAIAASTSDTYLWVGTDQLLTGVQMSNCKDGFWDSANLLTSHSDDNLSNLGRCVLCHPNSDRLWVGTTSGLFTYKPSQEWELCVNSEQEDIRALVLNPNDPETPWILSWSRGVSKLQPDGLLEKYDSQPYNVPLLLVIGQDGYPCVLTERALWRLKTDNYEEIYQVTHSYSRVLTQTLDGVWWLGTEQGLYRQWQFVGEPSGPRMAAIYTLTEFQKNLWVATANGLWTLQDNNWVQLNLELPSKGAPTWALAPSLRSEELWLACEEGVFCYNISTKSISKHYTCTNSGLASHRVTALVESTQALWIVTQAGISCVKLD